MDCHPSGKRLALAIGLTVALTSAQFGDAAVQDSDFPKHAIKLIVGPSPDVFSRIVAEHLQEAWGQPVIVEPRPGAGGKIAVNAVLAAPPDGYTMLFTTPTYTLNTAMKVATYDLLKEFDAVAIVGLISYALVAHPSVPAKSVPELINYAKRNPGKLNCASAGIGTVPHLACEYLNKIAGVSLVHVPFRDVNSAMMATVGNTTQIFFGVATNAKAQIDAGALRGLAVSTERRSLLLPDIASRRRCIRRTGGHSCRWIYGSNATGLGALPTVNSQTLPSVTPSRKRSACIDVGPPSFKRTKRGSR